MRRMLVFWFMILLAILYFSLGIARAGDYQCHVLTDTGTYRIYRAPWWELQKEFNRRLPKHTGLQVLAFTDSERKEIWYSEDDLKASVTRASGFRSLHKHPLEVELENVLKYRNLVEGFTEPNDHLATITHN
jgi:hypothetical protein